MKTVVTRFFVLGSAALLGFSGSDVAIATNLTAATKTLPAFNRVSIEISGSVRIVFGSTHGAEIQAEKKVIDAIRFEVEREELKITSISGYRTNRPLSITVKMPSINQLSIDSSGDVVIGAVPCKSLRIASSGSGNVKAERLNCTNIEIESNGSGDITISGKSTLLVAKAMSSGSIDAQSLVANDVRSTQDGSGDVLVHATHSLTASLDGAGELKYRGSIKPKVTVSGVGEVVKLP